MENLDMQTMFKPTTAEAALTKVLESRGGFTARGQAKGNAESAEKAKALTRMFNLVLEESQVKIEEPSWTTPQEVSESLVSQLTESGRVGKLTMIGDGEVEVYGFEPCVRRGVLQNTVTLKKKTHRIINPRFNRIPYAGPMPKKAQRIQDQLCQFDELRRASRVLTGTVIGMDEQDVDQWRNDTALTKAGKQTAAALGRASRATAQAVNRSATSVREAGRSLSAAFAPDPAIVIGDLVLFVWLD